MGVSAVFDREANEVRLGVDPVASTVCRRGDLNSDRSHHVYSGSDCFAWSGPV